MTDRDKREPSSDAPVSRRGRVPRDPARLASTLADLLPLPGLAAISVYLLVLAGVIILGVVSGRHYPAFFLIFAAALLATSGGLVLLFRWAWSLALSAVFLLVAYNFWIFYGQHQAPPVVQGLLNLVFFLYLVRPEVRERLR